MKKTNYPLAILINVVSTLLPIGGLAFIVYCYSYGKTELTTLSYVVLTISVLQWLILKKPLKSVLNKAVLDNEYDENGVSKKKKFENLTRQEREAMDLQKASMMESLLPSSVIEKIIKKGSTDPENDLNDQYDP